MTRSLPAAAALAAALIAAAPLAAAPLSPDAGTYKAEGSWTDQEGQVGQWQAEGSLQGGKFGGTLSLELLGVSRSVIMTPERARLRDGRCVLRGVNGRNRVELRGPCEDGGIGPGTLTGTVDGHRLRGTFKGTLATGPEVKPDAEAAKPAA